MSNLQLIEQSPGYFTVEGELTFAGVDKSTINTFNFLKGIDVVYIDLANVKSTDSAGLALMIEWIKHCKHSRTRIRFKNIPEQIRSLAKLSGLDNTDFFTDHPT